MMSALLAAPYGAIASQPSVRFSTPQQSLSREWTSYTDNSVVLAEGAVLPALVRVKHKHEHNIAAHTNVARLGPTLWGQLGHCEQSGQCRHERRRTTVLAAMLQTHTVPQVDHNSAIRATNFIKQSVAESVQLSVARLKQKHHKAGWRARRRRQLTAIPSNWACMHGSWRRDSYAMRDRTEPPLQLETETPVAAGSSCDVLRAAIFRHINAQPAQGVGIAVQAAPAQQLPQPRAHSHPWCSVVNVVGRTLHTTCVCVCVCLCVCVCVCVCVLYHTYIQRSACTFAGGARAALNAIYLCICAIYHVAYLCT